MPRRWGDDGGADAGAPGAHHCGEAERRGRARAGRTRVRPVLDAVRRAAADLLRTDRDHGFGRGAGRFAIGGAAAGGAGPPRDVWSRSARVFEMPVFGAIARMAAKVVVDSAGSRTPSRRCGCSRRRRGRNSAGRSGVDAADTRREMLARLFENRKYLAKLAGISTVRVVYIGEFADCGVVHGRLDCGRAAGCGSQRAARGGGRSGSRSAPRGTGRRRVSRGVGASARQASSYGRRRSELHQPAAAERLSNDARGTRNCAQGCGVRAGAGIRGPSRVCYGLMSVRGMLSPMRPRPRSLRASRDQSAGGSALRPGVRDLRGVGRVHAQAAFPKTGRLAVPLGPRSPVLGGRAHGAAHRPGQQLQNWPTIT